MIIKSVILENVGLFRGMNEFVFARGAGAGRPRASVVAGKNGVGKTTLFRAAPFALHGASSVGERVSQRDYAAYLGDLLHRTVGPNGYQQRARKGRVTVEIAYVRSGRAHSATVTREIRVEGSRVIDELFLESDELDHRVPDPQAWVNDLLPPSVASVWLFDSEDLGRLIGADERAGFLKRTFQRLLGVHLVERLVADLNYFMLKSGVDSTEPLRVKLLEAKAVAEAAHDESTKTEVSLNEIREEKARAVSLLRQLENELAAEGGAYARLRERNASEAKEVEDRIARLEDLLRRECDGLLPVATSRRMLLALIRRLDELERDRGIGQHLEILTQVVDRVFLDAKFVDTVTHQLGVEDELMDELRNAFISAVARTSADHAIGDGAARAPLHDLSSSEHQQLRKWALESGDSYRAQLHSWAHDLLELRSRLANLKDELRRAPNDERLAGLHERIFAAQSAVDEVTKRENELLRSQGELAGRVADAERQFERLKKLFEDSQRQHRGADLAVRSRNATTVYQDALIRQKLHDLEDGILHSFNAVCRKQHLLSRVRIDPQTFRTELEGFRGHKVLLEEFSAGERQLYNMAVFKAMRDVSGLDLPFFVDTPFARLDGTHRQRLVSGLFQDMANQIVLFMTDAEGIVLEIGGGLALEPQAHWLEADLARQSTAVSRIAIDEVVARARETAAA